MAAVTLTREPTDRVAVVAVVLGAALVAACLTAMVALALEERSASFARPRRRAPRRATAWRRALGVGALVATIGLLRAVDGLTVLTAGFVLAGFILAELVLSTRPAPGSG